MWMQPGIRYGGNASNMLMTRPAGFVRYGGRGKRAQKAYTPRRLNAVSNTMTRTYPVV